MQTGQRNRQCDSGDDDAGDSRSDDRHQIEQSDENAQQQRVGDVENHQPEEGGGPGDHRDQHIAQHVRADLGEHFIADEDGARPTSVGHQSVQVGADAGHVNQEVHGQHDDDQGVG